MRFPALLFALLVMATPASAQRSEAFFAAGHGDDVKVFPAGPVTGILDTLPVEYAGWWSADEQCAGVSHPLDWEFRIVKADAFTTVWDGPDKLWQAYTAVAAHRIYVIRGLALSEAHVRHAMLVALLADAGKPYELPAAQPDFDRCGL